MRLSISNSKFVTAIERFLRQESAGGVLLFGAAAVAMVVANSPWATHYFDALHTEAGVIIGSFHLELSLAHWINDGLMALFFLLIGLEIKRELMVGELSSPAKAAFPAVAALGGMIAPALIYLAINTAQGGEYRGFGIPMATDIAFALGFLMLLGKRVPMALKVFLVSLAVIDDLGAILIIAVAYSGTLDWSSLGWAGLVIGGLIALNAGGVKKLTPYLALGLVLWYLIFQSGIHATIAGVILALTIPVKQKISSQEFVDTCKLELDVFGSGESQRKNILLTHQQQEAVEKMSDAYESVQNPLVRLEHALLPISAFFIMPLFALANAGVALGGEIDLIQPTALGVVIGLLIGKPVGIIGLTFLISKLGWITKPASCQWRHIIGAGILGGVGFTMSVFITGLAFTESWMIDSAKLAIITASLVAGLSGVYYLFRLPAPSTCSLESTSSRH
ncbi:Na+:H+ antiporter, NhaA family [Dehalogenimonas formicexedens]|uniref:Na(+)/H(+) antiporter NhaA n=1 Tax=Dehalogenimonas formicexedens TaxID=1839801 RepID=A0A1P8F8R1_9CHLR|nr:Na+/H+ antiporter NhaA [Dehalogenimonas formicexedens]APV44835.1 Na+:H+ antiporter, NhaA family [Dehalogenimonas formicexedens]